MAADAKLKPRLQEVKLKSNQADSKNPVTQTASDKKQESDKPNAGSVKTCTKKHGCHDHFEVKKSYCQIHEGEEIVYACYQCQVMCCSLCAYMHTDHTKAYFKDCFVENNYDNIDQTLQETLQQMGTIHSSGNIFFHQN